VPSEYGKVCMIFAAANRRQIHFIQPHVVGGQRWNLSPFETQYQSPLNPIPADYCSKWDAVNLTVEGQGTVVHLTSGALDVPGQMVPGVRRNGITGDGRFPPRRVRIVPNVPHPWYLAFEVALRTPCPALRGAGSGVVISLIEIKLQGLRLSGWSIPKYRS
jgi:hypothetical protein